MDVSSIVHAKFAASNPRVALGRPYCKPARFILAPLAGSHTIVAELDCQGLKAPVFILAFYDLTSSNHSISRVLSALFLGQSRHHN